MADYIRKGISHRDDTAFRVADDVGTPTMGLADDTAPDSVDEGDVGVVRMSLRRELYVQLRDAAGNERGVNVTAANALAVAGTGTFTTSDTATLVDDAAFTPTTSRVMAIGAILDDIGPDTVDEEDIGAVRMSSNRNLYVRIRDNAGNERGLNIDASGRALVDAVGNAAHDATADGNPVAVGGISQDMDDTAPPNQVSAEGEATRLACDRDGALFVRPFGPRIWSYHENSSNALTDTSVHAAPATGLSLYVTDIVVSTGAATALNIFFEEGATTVLGPWYLEAVAGRGLAIHFQTPKKITSATALTVTTSAAIAHSIDVTGFTAAG